MKRLSVLFPLFRAYRWNLVSNAVLNAIGAVLSLFSFLSVVPFLRILFSGKSTPTKVEVVPLADDIPGKIGAWFDGYVLEGGDSRALIMVCIAVVVLAGWK